MYPVEIEEVIRTHPDVAEAGVFGVPDDVVQELVTAAVVKKPGSDLTEQEVEKLVADKLEDFKRLRGGVFFVDKIPTNQQGKILRPKLRERFERQVRERRN